MSDNWKLFCMIVFVWPLAMGVFFGLLALPFWIGDKIHPVLGVFAGLCLFAFFVIGALENDRNSGKF